MAYFSHFIFIALDLIFIYNINMEVKITKKQFDVLNLIYDSVKDSGFPPTMAELKNSIRVLSNQSVINFLKALEGKGCIKRIIGQARGIKILPLGFKILKKSPLISLAGESSAGAYVETIQHFSTWIELPSITEQEQIKQAEDNLFAIQVHGDSMINAGISDEDVLLIKQTQQFKSGDIVVARSDDGTTVKRFVAESNGRAYLKPENPAYEIIPIFEDTYFDGKVIFNLTTAKSLF